MSSPRSKRTAPPRKTAYHHGDLRRALLDATLRLVDQRGPQGFTLRGVAAAAGVTPSATYHHFKDKDDLLVAVAEDGFEGFRRVLEAAAQAPASSGSERSRKVGIAYVLFAIRNTTLFRVMFGYGKKASMRRGGVPPSVMAAYQLVREALIEGLKRGSGEVISEAEVLGWWSVVHGLAFLAMDGALASTEVSAGRVESIVRAVFDAMDVRGHGATGSRGPISPRASGS